MPETRLGPFQVVYDNSSEYHHLKREVFTQNLYAFAPKNPSPKILDVGAHIGISVLTFLYHYPAATIVAVEPHPQSFALLQQNIELNGLSDQVTLLQAAVVPQGKSAVLFSNEVDRWRLSASLYAGGWDGRQTDQPMTVPAISLQTILHEPFDLVKMDIEGAEAALLRANTDLLPLARQWLIEYHDRPGSDLPHLVKLLQNAGFRVECFKDGRSVLPNTVRGLALLNAQRAK